MQGTTEKWVVIGNQDFVCGHFSNDPVFFMGRPMHSDLAKAPQGTATELHRQGTFNAKNALQIQAAP
jgi:hypothetical protein